MRWCALGACALRAVVLFVRMWACEVGAGRCAATGDLADVETLIVHPDCRESWVEQADDVLSRAPNLRRLVLQCMSGGVPGAL